MRDNIGKVFLTLSSLCLAFGVLISRRNPAQQFELSIYSGTPTIALLLFSFAIVLSTIIAFLSNQKIVQGAGGILALSTVFAVTALPVIRGYWLIGGDAATHVGYALDIKRRVVGPLEILYPLTHTLSTLISHITALGDNTAITLISPIFVLAFVVGCLTTASVSNLRNSRMYGLYLGLLLMPINSIAVHIAPHPTSFAIMMSPIIIFILFRSYQSMDPRWVLLVVLSLSSFLLLHPQQFVNLMTVVVSLYLVHFVINYHRGISLKSPRNLVFIGGIIFTAHSLNYGRVAGNLTGVIGGISVGADVDPTGGRGASLGSIGAGLDVIFLRVFLVPLIMSLITAAIIFAYMYKFRTSKQEADVDLPIIFATTLSLSVVTGLMAVFLVAGITQQFLRFHGFAMVLVTIIAAIGLARYVPIHQLTGNKRAILSLVFCFLIVFSGATYHASPLMFKDSGHVPENYVESYGTMFEHHSEDVVMNDIQTPVYRMSDAQHGRHEQQYRDYTKQYLSPEMPDHFDDQNLSRSFDRPMIVQVTSRDRQLQAEMYDGNRFSEDDFEYLEKDPDIVRAFDSGEVNSYYVHSTGE